MKSFVSTGGEFNIQAAPYNMEEVKGQRFPN